MVAMVSSLSAPVTRLIRGSYRFKLWSRKNIHIKWLTCASSATDAPSTSSVLLNANNSMSFSLRLFSSATRCASVLGSNCLVGVGVG